MRGAAAFTNGRWPSSAPARSADTGCGFVADANSPPDCPPLLRSPDRDPGRSATAKFYGLSGEEEARAYLAHPLLGPRYRESVAAVRAWLEKGRSLQAIFGELDAMKFRSSLQLLGAAEDS